MNRNQLTDSYLLYYSGEHVWYETHMFFQAAVAILGGTALQSASPGLLFLFRNSTLEAFGFHLRNLLDFFRPPKTPRGTDIIAADFFDTNCLPDDFPKLSLLAEAARERANKELAHLTTLRKQPTDPEKHWPVKELTQEITALVKHFVQGASPNKLDSSYITQAKQMLNF